MLTDQDLRETSKRRLLAVLPTMICAILAVCIYFIGVGHFRESLTSLAVNRFGETARDVTPIALILPAFAIFLLPSLVAAGYADFFRTICPLCGEDVTSRNPQILSTRCCPRCNKRILNGGQTHSTIVYKRYEALRSRSLLKYWLWSWPALGVFPIAWQWLDHSAFQRCPQCLWIGPLIGTSVAGWSWFRTLDRRYGPPLLASLVLLGLGASLFWRTL